MATATLRTRNIDPVFMKEVYPRLPPMMQNFSGVMDIHKARKGMGAMSEGKRQALDGPMVHLRDSVTIENIKVATRDGYEGDMRITKPASGGDNLPVVYSLHGGGYMTGDNDTEDLINRQYANVCKVIIFAFEYRLAPEHPVVTTIFNDAEDGLKWVYANAKKYGGDVSQGIIVSGTSVGGQMASMLSYRAATKPDHIGVPIKGTIMRQPALMFNHPDDIPAKWKSTVTSADENADAPILNKALMEITNDHLKIAEKDLSDPWNFPLFATDLSKMPPLYIVGAGCDPFADHVVLYGKLFEEAGVPAKVKVYEGMPHGFHAFHVLKQARQEMDETARGLTWLINGAK